MSLTTVEPENPKDFIEGAEPVINYYGYWATFHDAAIVSLLFEPENETLIIVFDYNDLTDDDMKSGSSRITLCWQEVIKLSLLAEYSNPRHADSLSEIEFTQGQDCIETSIVPIDGIGGIICSKSVRVTQFEIIEDTYEKSNTAFN